MRPLDWFPLPVGSPKTSGWGPRWGRFHYGCDYGCPVGTPVYAPWSGTVASGSEPRGAGNWIWVTNSDGDVFKCFHLSGYAISSGKVQAGTVIASTGNTGASTGPHAHLELHRGGPSNPVDPTALLDAAQNGAPSPGPMPAPHPPLIGGKPVVPHTLDGRVFVLVPRHDLPHGYAWQAVDNPQTLTDLYAAGYADPNLTVKLGAGDTAADARFGRYAVTDSAGNVERLP